MASLSAATAAAPATAPAAPCLLVGGAQATAFSFDGLGGEPALLGASAAGCGASPGFMAFSSTQPGIVYSTAESVVPAVAGLHSAVSSSDAVPGITTSRVECYGGPGAASFSNLSHVATDGACHVAVHPSGRWVFSAAYDAGSIAWMPVLPDGTLGAAQQLSLGAGSKAHAVNFDASGRFVFVPCLGSDSVAQFVFDDATGALSPNPAGASAALPAGSGPRHMVFLPTNVRVAFVLCELASLVVPFAFDPARGVLSPSGAAPVSTIRPGLPAPSVQAAAELLASADGLFLYATNRAAPFGAGDNSVAVLPLTRGGALAGGVAQWAAGEGAGALSFPRHAALSFAAGQPWLFVVGQYSGALTVFARDAATGLLQQANATSALNAQPTFVGEVFA